MRIYMKQDNSEALKALGHEEPICNTDELHETSNTHETKAKTLPRQNVVNCTTCAFTDSKYTEETCNKCSRGFDKHEPK